MIKNKLTKLLYEAKVTAENYFGIEVLKNFLMAALKQKHFCAVRQQRELFGKSITTG